VGKRVRGKVMSLTDYGAFVELEPGVEGLIHVSEMSWTKKIKHPSKMLEMGAEIECQVLEVDARSKRISLGLKQLEPDPWMVFTDKYKPGDKVVGKVRSLTDYGVFVGIEDGVDGMVHKSDISWTQRVNHPSELFQKDDKVEAVILNINHDEKKVSLGIKQLEPDPWSTVDHKYPVGSRHDGKVRNLTAFGAFIELEEGIDGLVHISDLSWTRRVQHPSEIMKKGDKVPVIVLHVDAENRKISLGHKQVLDDPWPMYHERFRVGNEKNGRIVRMLDRGVVVDLESEVEGFVPLNQLGKKDLEKPDEAFKAGDILNLRVIEFDPTNRRIVLSVDAFFKDKDRSELEKFLAAHPTIPTTVAEVADLPAAKADEAEAVAEDTAIVDAPEPALDEPAEGEVS
jgi:small subunit ribosomal protein S1